MRLKSIVLFLAMLTVVVGLVACGGSEPPAGEDQGARQDTEQTSPEPTTDVREQAQVPEDKTLKLTVPKISRIEEDTVPYGPGTDDQLFHDYAAVHLQGTGHPWDEEANVYIAGHRLGYPNTDSFLAFYDIDKLENGDEVVLTDANGKEYRYEVFNELVVEPTDLHVLEPIAGKNIVTLQTCTLPDYTKRVIVQAELKA
jgi:sortase A